MEVHRVDKAFPPSLKESSELWETHIHHWGKKQTLLPKHWLGWCLARFSIQDTLLVSFHHRHIHIHKPWPSPESAPGYWGPLWRFLSSGPCLAVFSSLVNEGLTCHCRSSPHRALLIQSRAPDLTFNHWKTRKHWKQLQPNEKYSVGLGPDLGNLCVSDAVKRLHDRYVSSWWKPQVINGFSGAR